MNHWMDHLWIHSREIHGTQLFLGPDPGNPGGAKKQIKANVVAPYAASRMSTLETMGISARKHRDFTGISWWKSWKVMGFLLEIRGILSHGIRWWWIHFFHQQKIEHHLEITLRWFNRCYGRHGPWIVHSSTKRTCGMGQRNVEYVWRASCEMAEPTERFIGKSSI